MTVAEKSRDDLWKNALVKDLGDGSAVQMVGMESPSHTVYARVVSSSPEGAKVTVGKVIELMVDEGWKHALKDILQGKKRCESESYPPASLLLKLGAAWLLNETAYTKGENTHAHRLTPEEETNAPDWKDMTLRVHYVPERFYIAKEYDWTKYCRGLLVGGNVEVRIGNETPHVPVVGLPDSKDGVIVYEDNDIGFAVINKPAPMPDHATVSNHMEDVHSMFKEALRKRHDNHHKLHVSLPFRVDTEMSGLTIIATKKEFAGFMGRQLERKSSDASHHHHHGRVVMKKYRCLVAVKEPESMDKLEELASAKTILTHYQDPKSEFPKTFSRNSGGDNWLKCQMRITKAGHERFRAACVLSKYNGSIDSSLAHWLWGIESATPAEDLGASYVMELEVELLTNRTHQLRGQLAALGFPIVGDRSYGGGDCTGSTDKHTYHRMALECCEIALKTPKWEEPAEGKTKSKTLVAGGPKGIFRLSSAWWTEYLDRYEQSM